MFYCVHHLQGCTAQTPTGSLRRVVLLFVSLVGQLGLDQISFGPLPPFKNHHGVDTDGIPTDARNQLCWEDPLWLK